MIACNLCKPKNLWELGCFFGGHLHKLSPRKRQTKTARRSATVELSKTLCSHTEAPMCFFFILFEPKIFAFCIVCCSIHSPKGAVRLCHKVFTCVCVSVCIHTYIVQMGHCQEGNQNKLLFFSFPATFTTGRTRQQQALYTFTSFLLSSILHLTNVAIPTGWGTCVFHQYLFKWNMNFISRHGLTLY